ncbi:HTH-type transcriptional regulator ImmR [compost metagenome]
MSLGIRLKKEREKRGWSQIYVAEKLGITNSVLSNYEREYRDPDTSMLSKLADLYEVDADYLLGRTDKPRQVEEKTNLDDSEQAAFEAFINNPEHGIFFLDYLSAPEERKEEMRMIFKILQEKEKGRKPGDRQGE